MWSFQILIGYCIFSAGWSEYAVYINVSKLFVCKVMDRFTLGWGLQEWCPITEKIQKFIALIRYQTNCPQVLEGPQVIIKIISQRISNLHQKNSFNLVVCYISVDENIHRDLTMTTHVFMTARNDNFLLFFYFYQYLPLLILKLQLAKGVRHQFWTDRWNMMSFVAKIWILHWT